MLVYKSQQSGGHVGVFLHAREHCRRYTSDTIATRVEKDSPMKGRWVETTAGNKSRRGGGLARTREAETRRPGQDGGRRPAKRQPANRAFKSCPEIVHPVRASGAARQSGALITQTCAFVCECVCMCVCVSVSVHAYYTGTNHREKPSHPYTHSSRRAHCRSRYITAAIAMHAHAGRLERATGDRYLARK